jgi:glycosyltransferase involved in cell wall biosynthesis
MPKFTLITAAWRRDGLKRIIECVNNQTVNEWQHVIVNDNSEEVREFLIKNNYFKDEQNRHVIDMHVRTHWFGCYARNIGAEIAFKYIKEKHREHGKEYIVFVDDDNYISPNHLEFLSREIEAFEYPPLLGVDFMRVGKKDINNRKHIKCQLVTDLCDLGCFAYRLDMFDKYGYFRARQEKKFKFDWEFIKKIADGEGRDNIKIVHTNNPTFYFYHKKY